VDNNTTEICKTDVYPWKEFDIFIDKDSITGEINIGIGAKVV